MNGLRTRDLVVVMKYLRVEILIMVHTMMENQMVKAFTNGRMAKFTTESGFKASNTDTVCGKALMESLILASGFNRRLKAMVCMFSLTVTNMKVNGTSV